LLKDDEDPGVEFGYIIEENYALYKFSALLAKVISLKLGLRQSAERAYLAAEPFALQHVLKVPNHLNCYRHL